jgi:hypothetical protein
MLRQLTTKGFDGLSLRRYLVAATLYLDTCVCNILGNSEQGPVTITG